MLGQDSIETAIQAAKESAEIVAVVSDKAENIKKADIGIALRTSRSIAAK